MSISVPEELEGMKEKYFPGKASWIGEKAKISREIIFREMIFENSEEYGKSKNLSWQTKQNVVD